VVHAANELHMEATEIAQSAAGTGAEEQVEGGAPARRRWPEPGLGVPTHIVEGDPRGGGSAELGGPFPSINFEA
jgi:hypothetical protein